MELNRAEVWHVRPDLSNLQEVSQDALEVIRRDGLPWLERMSDLRYALSLYRLKETEGRPLSIAPYGSPAAAAAASGIAIHLLDFEAAKEIWMQGIEPFYERLLPHAFARAKAMVAAVEEERERADRSG